MEERDTVERLIPYLEDSDIKDVFHRWYINNKNDNLISIFLYDKIRGNLQNFFTQKAIDSSLTLLQQQIIAIAPHHRDFYIINNWRGANGCYPCVLTNYSYQGGNYATQSFPLNDPVYANFERILRSEPFKPEIRDAFKEDEYLFGLEIYFRYRSIRFRYYNQNRTVRLVGLYGRHIGQDEENTTYVVVTPDETTESLKNKLDALVEYSQSLRLRKLHEIFEMLTSLNETPIYTGFQEDKNVDKFISYDEILSYRWSSVEVERNGYSLSCTIDRDHNVEVGLRVFPGKTKKDKLTLQKIDSSLAYHSKNHFWYYVYSEFQLNLEIIIREFRLLCSQYKSHNN